MKMSSFRHIQLSENDSKLLNFNETNQASERLAAEAAVEAEVISGRSGWWSSFKLENELQVKKVQTASLSSVIFAYWL